MYKSVYKLLSFMLIKARGLFIGELRVVSPGSLISSVNTIPTTAKTTGSRLKLRKI